MSSQRTCRWCHLDADLASTRMPSGTPDTLEHAGRGTQVACLEAMLGEIHRLRDRVTALEAENGGTQGCVCVGTPDEEDCPHDA